MESSSLTRDRTPGPLYWALGVLAREVPSSRAWERILAYPALHDALIVGFSPSPHHLPK